MKESLKVYEGKVFSVVLQAVSGTQYQWCLKEMPEGIILIGEEYAPVGTGRWYGGPLNQIFYFVPCEAAPQAELTLAFIYTAVNNVKDVKDSVKIELLVAAAEEAAGNGVTYGQNSAAYQTEALLEWPPVNWPPVNGAAANWPPVNWPPVNASAVNWPPVNWPPVNGAAVNWPPVNNTAVNWPPVNDSAVNWPPVNNSACTWPPVN